VKKITLLPILFIVVVLWGCTSKENEKQKPASQGKDISLPIAPNASFMTSQTDAFHKNSKIESTRKKSLTDFGIITIPLPTPTPNADVAREVINPGDKKLNNVGLFTNFTWVDPAFPFDYENDLTALKSLFKLHNLDQVIPVKGEDMDKLTSLMKYTYSFLDGGKISADGTVTGPSAFLITKNRKEKNIGGNSDIYAALLCQLSLACGYNSRIISMHTFDSEGKPLTHDVCDIYVNTLGKWVAFDAYNNATYYLRNSIPQSALELHKVIEENRIREIYPVSLLHESTDVAALRDKVLPKFKYIYMWRMNNILSSSPRGGSIPWQTLYQAHLVWEDALSPASEGGFDKIDKFSQGGVRFVTHNRSDFDWMIDHMNITLERQKDESLKFYLTTITPNFDYFDIHLDPKYEMDVNFKPMKSKNIFHPSLINKYYQITPVNKFGIKGYPSAIEFGQ
jgi:hypothetical protein